MATASKRIQQVDRSTVLDEIDRLLHHGNVPVAVAMTDLDGFAEVNDKHGRAVGDAVLAAWERVLTANLDEPVVGYRVGGDEYAVVLPGTSAENALVLLQELRSHFSSRPVEGVPGAMSVSVGVAANPPHGTTAHELWRAAGEALMRAKREGRDRIALYVEEKMTLKSNYYSKAGLERLAKLSEHTDRTEASLLREALDDLFDKYADQL